MWVQRQQLRDQNVRASPPVQACGWLSRLALAGVLTCFVGLQTEHQAMAEPALATTSETASEAIAQATDAQATDAQATDAQATDTQFADTQSAAALIQAGNEFLDKGWADDAIAAFEAALVQEPDALAARLGLAMAYQKAGRDEPAWNAYQAVLAQNPNEPEALQAVGTMGSYRSEWQVQGIEALDRLLDPGNTASTAAPRLERQWRTQRALLLGYQQRFPEALADYDILLAQPNPSPAVLVNAAQIYTYSDRTDRALPLFERYRATGGDFSAPATLAYGTALRKQGQYNSSIRLLRDFKPDNADQAFEQVVGLSLAHQGNGDTAQALETLQPLLDPLLPAVQQRRAIANVLTTFDALPPRLKPTLETLLQEPEPVEFLRFRLAQIQLEEQDWAGARENLLAYQAATPEFDLGTEFLLASLEQQSGQLEASAERYENLRNLATGDPQLDALRGLAAIRFEQQRLGEAEALYREVLAQRPDDADALQTFAELLLAQDKPKAALDQFEAAQLSLADPTDPSARLKQRQRSVRRSFLRRRGFQPPWERY